MTKYTVVKRLNNKRRRFFRSNDVILKNFEQEKEFSLLLNKLNDKIKQAEFNLNDNGAYLIKEHCTEIRRQVQLSKEETLIKVEEITNEILEKIDAFESRSSDYTLKADKDKLSAQLIQIKNVNEKWAKNLDEYKVDLELLDDLRDSLFKFSSEQENFYHLLFNSQLLEFKPNKDISIGKLSNVTIDSFELEMDLSKQVNDIKYNFEDHIGHKLVYFVSNCSFFSNGDFILVGSMTGFDRTTACYLHGCAFFFLFDLNKQQLKLEKKSSFFKIEQYASCSDKICVLVIEMDWDVCLHNAEQDDFKIFNGLIVIDQNLEILNKISESNGELKGASDSFLIFSKDPNPKRENESCLFFLYNWSLQFVRAIGKSTDIEKLVLCSYHFLNQIYSLDLKELDLHLKAFDDTTGIMRKSVILASFNQESLLFEEIFLKDVFFDCHNNIVISLKGRKSQDEDFEIRYYNLNGDLLSKSKHSSNLNILTDGKRNMHFFDKGNFVLYTKKKLNELNYVTSELLN
jgi:hypothetical protein